MSNNIKVRVVHTGSRDHYQVAASFAERSRLERLVTSGYYKKKSRVLKAIGGDESFGSRSSPLVPDELVDAHLFVDYAKSLSAKAGLERYISMAAERRFGKLAARSCDSADIVLAYNYIAHTVFPYVQSKRVLFQCHPNPAALKDQLFENVDLTSTGFALEREISWGDSYRSRLETEWELADQILVASSFVKKSLIMAGAKDSSIHINPYGCRQVPGVLPRNLASEGRKTLLFVGQLVWRKGADLLSRIASLNSSDFDLIVVTRGLFDPKIMKSLEGLSNVKVYRQISSAQLTSLYQSVDALLFPSRFEGYGLVINEALSYGLPVISSKNTAFMDIWPNYKAGALLEKHSVEDIQSSLESLFCKDNYDLASEHALHFARENSWEKFRDRNRSIVLGGSEHTS